ncbi:MAG: antibiotic biosynthesis monooxygenase [Pseudomonadales bacterium]|nr:antibiotic biosynthesis monooxygenase [Pseudomonadales bacterium]
MIGQMIRLKIKEGTQEEFESLVGQLMKDVNSHEPGSIYDVRRVRGEPLTYLYFISFPDQAAFDRYMAAEYHTQMSPKALALLDGDPIFEDLDTFA